MKKKYKSFIKILFALFFTIFTTSSFTEEFDIKIKDEAYACNLYYKSITDSTNPMATNAYGYYVYKGYGFFPKEKYSLTERKWGPDFDEGYLKVGSITSQITASKVKIGDKILKINGAKPDENFNYIDLLLNKEIDQINMELMNEKDEIYKVEIDKHAESYSYLNYSIREFIITDIDVKSGTYTATLEETFEFSFGLRKFNSDDDDLHVLNELAQNKLIYFDEVDEEWSYHVCDPTDILFENRTLLDPYTIKNLGLIKSDKDYITITNKIMPYHEKLGNRKNEILFQRKTNRLLQIKNDFRLKSFPFDKQFIRYEVVDNGFNQATRQFESSNFTIDALERFMAIDDIPGWKKKDYRMYKFLHKSVAQEDGTAMDGIGIEIELERKHGYYIYKVILPIILILSVCWSVVWVDPKELEARLTITIVCLLSLIAYNFVIDSELPKLEYLTVLDWIVLVSYVYATFPNFLSVISFRLHKSNSEYALKLETNCRKYGLLSYIISVFVIIWLNSLFNFDNSSSLINWMTPLN